jgi:hypothetical protein
MVFGKINCVFFHWLICCTHKMSHTCVGAARKVWVVKFKTRTSPAFSWLHLFARLLFLLSPWKCPGVPHREAFGFTCRSFVCSWVVNQTDLITFPRICCLVFCFSFGTSGVGTPSVGFGALLRDDQPCFLLRAHLLHIQDVTHTNTHKMSHIQTTVKNIVCNTSRRHANRHIIPHPNLPRASYKYKKIEQITAEKGPWNALFP